MSVNTVENFVSKSYAQKIIDLSDVFLKEIGYSRPGYFEDPNPKRAISKENYVDPPNVNFKTEDDRMYDMLLCNAIYITKKHLENFYQKEGKKPSEESFLAYNLVNNMIKIGEVKNLPLTDLCKIDFIIKKDLF
jgi:hypothetical protein